MAKSHYAPHESSVIGDHSLAQVRLEFIQSKLVLDQLMLLDSRWRALSGGLYDRNGVVETRLSLSFPQKLECSQKWRAPYDLVRP